MTDLTLQQVSQQLLAERCAKWNEASMAKPGAKVRVYEASPDGTILVTDMLREEAERVIG